MARWQSGDRELQAHLGDGRILFRLVHSESTTEDDWRSHYELGARPRKTEIESALDHMGLSMWDNPEILLRLIERPSMRKALGEFVAEVEVKGSLGVWFAETHSEGHFTIWGRPQDLQRCVRLPTHHV